MSENGQEKRKTLADIVAELRDDDIDHADLICFREDGSIDMTELAGRIEAAWKRQMSQSWHHREMEELILRHGKEIAKLKDQTGNAAAIYNALKTIHDKVNSLNEECGVDPVEIRDIARAALSKPVRNCDRFADELDAQLAFLNEVWLISVDRETMLERDKYENWTDEMRTRYGRWLLAPAAQEGAGE